MDYDERKLLDATNAERRRAEDEASRLRAELLRHQSYTDTEMGHLRAEVEELKRQCATWELMRNNMREQRDAATLQIRELCGALVARRAMEPQHSREDHTCKECELVADIIHSEMRPTEKRQEGS